MNFDARLPTCVQTCGIRSLSRLSAPCQACLEAGICDAKLALFPCANRGIYRRPYLSQKKKADLYILIFSKTSFSRRDN
ncbi:hypothetical protein PUN28_014993 [Cardiocondyla obscurior]|uniref:Uncharacterized protein n=1 Tax=Cardiocondyla obscurior TaxID=286306 RepID=A0AAW2EYX6_9HYME